MSVLLDTHSLSISFSPTQRPALHKLGLRIERGECVALVGESGSGKSLTSLSIMGLLPASAVVSEGSAVWYNGQNMVSASPEERRLKRGSEIAMVFQEPMTALNPVMRCGQQVAEHLALSKAAARKTVLDLFEEVELPDPSGIFNSYPHQISGGQKQRVMIAMAIANNPQLLIADEPTTALDVTVQAKVIALIKRLQEKRNMAVLFITHDLELVKDIAQRVMVLYQGELVEEGPIAKVFSQPKHPYTKALLNCRPPLDTRPLRLTTVDQQMNPGREEGLISPSDRKRHLDHLSRQAPILQVNGLSKSYESAGRIVQAVKRIDFELRPGESLGLVGESGCGKSTVGKCLIGLEQPDEGQVLYNGADFMGLPVRAKSQRIQLVFQDPYSSLPPRMTVGQMLEEVLVVHAKGLSKKERAAQVDGLLEEVGLSASQRDRYPHEFSGGQRQRLVIARALLPEPEILICDESVSALDVSVQAQVLNLLNDLQERRGLSYLFISHDLAVVRYFCDHILVMQQGEIVERGESDALFEAPVHPYTQKLLSAIPGR